MRSTARLTGRCLAPVLPSMLARAMATGVSTSGAGSPEQRAHVKAFMTEFFTNFNASNTVQAAQGWVDHLEGGGKMMLTMAGAMSTAQQGKSVAELIRQDKVHGITCTGANLEEDFFNLIAHSHYAEIKDIELLGERVPGWRELSSAHEQDLFEKGYNRVTDTCRRAWRPSSTRCSRRRGCTRVAVTR